MLPRTIILNTERLYLHEMTAEEADDAFELNNDPEVTKFTGDPPFESTDTAREFLINYADYKKNGMGRWAVRLRENDTFLGWCGLKLHDNGEVDLGFRFHKRFWNQGFATEASLACLHFAFNEKHLEYVIGRVIHDNIASQKVLEKIGMKYWKDVICDEHPAKCYRIDHPNQ
ncbi:MAG: GNAT family N-acetyltransferase [Salibacteraceae bacterium]|jgi:[ribosomal protein S5]-alanine N-acetyltransferase|nr:GNAT family N-acetyltransferase [Salibacteraceae bacterium]MDP4685394.1 GNAT family N-acetyltransferase [Salibacteraceae bacterium]MDP4762336.1 GNAT family N-acetyltransferase [Salibacteraceae bacterium]MDP4842845.1 GNAT family N-acetyltransferase [Salibacteraceae bacterium]MDP4935252.1 GNAT family N-acetyltransferase [Salibacteraceae bacterium]